MDVDQKARSTVARPFAIVSDQGRFVLLVLIGVLAVTSIPFVYGHLTTPPDKWFSGVVYNMHDTAQYFSWMRESAQALFIENKLTAEPSGAIFLNLHWWLPGRLAALTGVSLSQIYQLYNLASVVLLIVATYALCSVVFADLPRRRFAFLLSLFTSGLGWIWVVLKQFTGEMPYPLDVYTTLGNSFYVMMASPPQAFAASLIFLVCLLALRGLKQKRLGLSAAAGLLALFLGMGHIYDLVTVWAVLGVFGLLLTVRDGFSWRNFWSLFLVVVLSAPSAVYWGWVASDANPMWKQALAQYDNLGVFTPNPLHLLILLGLTFLAAGPSFKDVARWRTYSDEQLFIRGWFITTPVLVYLPLHFQIMLLTGYQFPMAALATVSLFDHVMPWLRTRPAAKFFSRWLSRERVVRLAPMLLLAAVLPTNLYLLSWRVWELRRHDYPYYLYRDEVAAMQALETLGTPDDVVLSSFVIGHYLPGLSGKRAFLANAVMTMNFYAKQSMVDEFYSVDTSDARRGQIIRDYGVRYVFYGPQERALGGFDPASSSLFERVFTSPLVQVYSVR